ncbi:glutathione peroxidase [Pelagibacterales bacterium SAG-MED39]|nr:glutathione peroxidase [Pelagibacterales bacterium SAG-MED39]
MFFFKNPVEANYEKLIYDFNIEKINGEVLNFSEFKDKPILLVNVASYCGFTKQYKDLQSLWDRFKEKGLLVVGIPSKSFNQEKDTAQEVKEFCEVNFNINFPLTLIYDVKGNNAHEIYKWAKKNYGNSAVPKWNFHKILIGKDGKIDNTFAPFTKPLSNKIVKNIEKILN